MTDHMLCLYGDVMLVCGVHLEMEVGYMDTLLHV